MANSYEFDPGKGFVALPCEIMDIDLTPGAFRLLVELCRMANRTGECWPSLGQLSDRIGRSKASISGYISELRDVELVETNNQKMANGYNYRLKYCVTFWHKWRSLLGAKQAQKSVQESECSVQPIERRVNSKKHIQKNHSSGQSRLEDTEQARLVSVFSRWSNLAKSAPFPSFNGEVSLELIEATKAITLTREPNKISFEKLILKQKQLWNYLSVDHTHSDLHAQCERLRERGITDSGYRAFEQTVQTTWKPFWQKPPTETQFDQLLESSQQYNKSESMLKMLKQYLRRWEISQKKLQGPSASPNLALNQAA